MATSFVSPTGSGDRSGSDWENAAPIGALNAMIARAGPGGEVLLLADAGAYRVNGLVPIERGGIEGQAVTIRGVDRAGNDMAAEFVGSRPVDWQAGQPQGNELFKLGDGADHLRFEDIAVRDVGTAFRVAGDVENLVIEQVDASNVRRFFENYASGTGGTATISGLTIRDVDVTGFSRTAVRLQYDTHDVLIEDLRADMAGQVGDDLPAGIQLEGTVHDVVIREVTVENVRSERGGYLNGDGFSAERGVRNVLFENTVARGNSDGGYDLKSEGTVLVGALAEENGRNYRFWGSAELVDSVGLNPVWRGGSSEQNQLWVAAGARVAVRDSAFVDAGSRTKVFSSEGVLSFDNVQVLHASDATLLTQAALPGVTGLETLVETLVASLGPSSAGAGLADWNLADWIDALTGRAVADRIEGSWGDDSFFVDHIGDVVVERAGAGIDGVSTTLDRYTLGTHVENLVRSGERDFAGTGNDANNGLTGSAGRDTLAGLDGRDTLAGRSGDDRLDGGKGEDTLLGGGGDDWLLGGWQSDTLHGDAGNDRLIGDVAWVSSTGARDWLSGGDGDDTLFGDGETLSGKGGHDWLSGLLGADVIHGDAERLMAGAQGGNDTLLGGNGNDRLFGDGAAIVKGTIGGADTLDGGAGNDLLDGGGGADLLTGGDGADRFVFAVGSGRDQILDFDSHEGDRIDLSAFGGAIGGLQVTKAANGLLLTIGADSILVHGAESLHPSDFLVT